MGNYTPNYPIEQAPDIVIDAGVTAGKVIVAFVGLIVLFALALFVYRTAKK